MANFPTEKSRIESSQGNSLAEEGAPQPESTVRTVRMTLEYDGSRFVGWQRQLNGISVQEAVEEALSRHLGERVVVLASGRTDAGVHALGQVISFRTRTTMPVRGIQHGAQGLLPQGISIPEAAEAAPDFDARRCARLRWYKFFLLNRDIRAAVGAAYITRIHGGRVDLDLLEQAAALLTGDHDFRAFRASTCEARRTRLTLHPPVITHCPDNVIMVDFRCRSFLQNMIRILTGSMVACAQRRLSLEDLQTMLTTGQRHPEARTLAPNGLFLYRVFYDEESDDE